MLSKASKAIARANTCAAQLKSKNQQLKYQLDSTRVTRARKRLQVNLNKRYSNIKAIKAAINCAAALQAKQASHLTKQEA